MLVIEEVGWVRSHPGELLRVTLTVRHPGTNRKEVWDWCPMWAHPGLSSQR